MTNMATSLERDDREKSVNSENQRPPAASGVRKLQGERRRGGRSQVVKLMIIIMMMIDHDQPHSSSVPTLLASQKHSYRRLSSYSSCAQWPHSHRFCSP